MATKKRKTTKKDLEPKGKIKVRSTKSPHYRTIHVDGVMTGVAPSSLLEVRLFSVHESMPLDITHQVGANGLVGKEIARTTQGGLVREFECGAIMDFNVAEHLAKSILAHVKKEKRKTP